MYKERLIAKRDDAGSDVQSLEQRLDKLDRILDELCGPQDPLQRADRILEKYNESDHPRDERGRWRDAGGGSSTGGSSTSTADIPPAEKKSRFKTAMQHARRAGVKAAKFVATLAAVVGAEAAFRAYYAAGMAVNWADAKAAGRQKAAPRLPHLTEQQAEKVLAKLPEVLSESELAQVIARLEAASGKETRMDDDKIEKLDPNFEALVERETYGGRVPRDIAAQRVIQKYGAHPDAKQISKADASVSDFMSVCDRIMLEKGFQSRTEAMREARRRHPDKFAAFQEV